MPRGWSWVLRASLDLGAGCLDLIFRGAWNLEPLPDQLQRNLLLDFVRQINVRAAALSPRLHHDRRDFRLRPLDPHPYLALVDLALDGFHGIRFAMHNALVDERPIELDHVLGRFKNLIQWPFITALDCIFHKRHPARASAGNGGDAAGRDN